MHIFISMQLLLLLVKVEQVLTILYTVQYFSPVVPNLWVGAVQRVTR